MFFGRCSFSCRSQQWLTRWQCWHSCNVTSLEALAPQKKQVSISIPNSTSLSFNDSKLNTTELGSIHNAVENMDSYNHKTLSLTCKIKFSITTFIYWASIIFIALYYRISKCVAHVSTQNGKNIYLTIEH